MDALFLIGQAVSLSALAYGCYLYIANRHLSDQSSIEREFREGSSLQPPAKRYDPMGDSRVAGQTGFLL